ncbi:MAG: radical SAM protein [Blautia sp.]
MLDRWGREIDYLRISLTDRCNLRCVYCMPEEGICQIPRKELLDQAEIIRICSVMAELGISRIKITGGEPLVRKICTPLIKELKCIPGIRQVTLTTNGLLLEKNLPELLQAGLDGVNISLDTLDRENFRKITRRDEFWQVQKGIKAALSYEGLKVKINCVPTIQTKEELLEIARLAKDHPMHVRFIEMMPVGLGRQFTAMREDTLREILENEFGEMIPIYEKLGNGPCHYFSIPRISGENRIYQCFIR